MNKRLLAVSTLALGATALTIATVCYSQKGINEESLIIATEEANTRTLTSADLATATFTNYRHSTRSYTEGQYDKKFQIDLGEGKYIDGLLLFADCGHQSVGDNLSEPFVIDCSSEESNNAYNFNVLLSVKGIKEVSFTGTYNANTNMWTGDQNVRTNICWAHAASWDSLVDFANGKDYSQLVNSPFGGFANYDADSFSAASFVNASGSMDHEKKSLGDDYNVINLSFNGCVGPHKRVEFAFNSIYLKYTC